ncbi:MAG: thioredoxin family protein [Planctomycetes bacterium]|nr:thioredoxin family protein [Planctomycetota bacterium]
MRRALESLPWASKASVDFRKKRATVTVVSNSYDEKAMLSALKSAGFGGSVVAKKTKPKPKVKTPPMARVAFHVTGLKKDKAGSTPASEPNRVTKALQASGKSIGVSWDYGSDVVTISYDAKATTPAKLAAVIKGLEYGAKEVAVKQALTQGSGGMVHAILPADAPKEFAKAFRAARSAGRPIVIDFWAPWCQPCVRLKKETLHDAKVVKALEGVEVIFVDVDKHPGLARAYGVETIPNLFFINSEGHVVERLTSFEKPGPFLKRLKVLKAKPVKSGKGQGH